LRATSAFRCGWLSSSWALVAAVCDPLWEFRLFFGSKFIALPSQLLLNGATVVGGMAQVLDQGLRCRRSSRPGSLLELAAPHSFFGVWHPGFYRLGIDGIEAAMLCAQF